VVALAISGLLLYDTDSEGFGVSAPLVIAVAVIFGLAVVWVSRKVMEAHRGQVHAGYEELIGAAAGEHRHRDPAAVGQADEADIAGVAVQGSGLVLDRSSERKQGAHSVLARLALCHQAEQIIAARRVDQLGAIDFAKQLDHRHRGR
jgi:hypothetical protein